MSRYPDRYPYGRKKLSRRQALKAIALGAAGATLAACGVTTGSPGSANKTPATTPAASQAPPPAANATPAVREAPKGRKIVLELYSVFAGNEHQGWIKLAERYEQVQSDVGIKITYSPGHQDNPKLLTSIAGGAAPDLAHLTPFSTPQWALLGVMTDLTEYVKQEGWTEDDWFPPAWNDMQWEGKFYQVQWDADPNFPFFWNQNLFEEVGLDPEKGPQTIDEVDEYSKKINTIRNGKVVRIGMIPWDVYGPENSLFTWGWSFGGEFWDPDKQEVTPDNDYVVKALEWMVRYAKSVGGPDKLSVTPPNLQLHPFGSGNIGMYPLVVPNYRDIRNAKPDMKIGHGLLPYEPPGAKQPGAGAWFGGWGLFIPKGAKNPDAAWEFIKWVSATPEGTKAQWETVGFPPAWKKAPVLEEIKNDPIMGPYYNVLISAKHSRPAIPVGAYYFGQLGEQVGEAINGKKTPLAAMRTAKENTMKEMQRFMKQNA